jgi:hypothetical protein
VACKLVTTLLTSPPSMAVMSAPLPRNACATPRVARLTARYLLGLHTPLAPSPAALVPRPSLVLL